MRANHTKVLAGVVFLTLPVFVIGLSWWLTYESPTVKLAVISSAEKKPVPGEYIITNNSFPAPAGIANIPREAGYYRAYYAGRPIDFPVSKVELQDTRRYILRLEQSDLETQVWHFVTPTDEPVSGEVYLNNQFIGISNGTLRVPRTAIYTGSVLLNATFENTSTLIEWDLEQSELPYGSMTFRISNDTYAIVRYSTSDDDIRRIERAAFLRLNAARDTPLRENQALNEIAQSIANNSSVVAYRLFQDKGLLDDTFRIVFAFDTPLTTRDDYKRVSGAMFGAATRTPVDMKQALEVSTDIGMHTICSRVECFSVLVFAELVFEEDAFLTSFECITITGLENAQGERKVLWTWESQHPIYAEIAPTRNAEYQCDTNGIAGVQFLSNDREGSEYLHLDDDEIVVVTAAADTELNMTFDYGALFETGSIGYEGETIQYTIVELP